MKLQTATATYRIQTDDAFAQVEIRYTTRRAPKLQVWVSQLNVGDRDPGEPIPGETTFAETSSPTLAPARQALAVDVAAMVYGRPATGAEVAERVVAFGVLTSTEVSG